MVKPDTEAFDHMMVSNPPAIARRMDTRSRRCGPGHGTNVGVARRMPQTRKIFHDRRDVSAAEPLSKSPHLASHLRRRRTEGFQLTGIRNVGPNRASVEVRRQVDFGANRFRSRPARCPTPAIWVGVIVEPFTWAHGHTPTEFNILTTAQFIFERRGSPLGSRRAKERNVMAIILGLASVTSRHE